MRQYRQNRAPYSATGASRTRRNGAALIVLLTVEDIARLTRSPARTIRARLAAWRDEGGPVVTLARRTRGRPPLAVHLDAYARRVARDPDELRAALTEAA